jgi:hypothetical protein
MPSTIAILRPASRTHESLDFELRPPASASAPSGPTNTSLLQALPGIFHCANDAKPASPAHARAQGPGLRKNRRVGTRTQEQSGGRT